MKRVSTVVIVEDDSWLAAHIERILQKDGYVTYVAGHGYQAIDLIDAHGPDAIIVDMLLGGGTGLALLHELQSHPDLSNIPVIACTNLAPTLKLDELRPYGVRRILDKASMRPEDIRASVRSVLV